jgi:membrane protease YdiL (CAAX protease family)
LDSKQKKALYSYVILLLIVSVYFAFSLDFIRYIIPFLLISASYALQKNLNLRFTIRDALIGIIASAAILAPFGYMLYLTGKIFELMPVNGLIFQLFAASLPEEAYFRGFIQERFGNNIRGIFIASLLFSLMHLPRLIFHGDIYSILTFFPSLIMGFLYRQTGNILPSVIFHFLANVVFLGFFQ